MSPFPWLPMLAIATSLVSHSYSLTSLFPYVGYMVQHIGLTDDKDKAGFYAGYLSSAFMVGRFSSSYFWGQYSDRHGRLPVIYLSLTTIASASIGFGLSTNFTLAMACRFLLGALNGIVAISKTMISEVCGPEHEVTGMSFITGAWSIGFIIGPGLGGMLAEPAKHYPRYFSESGLFGRFPYLLPNVVGASLALIALPMVFFFLYETNPPQGSLRRAMDSRNRGGFRRDPASDGATNGRDKDDLAEEGRSHNQSLTLTVPLGVHPRQNTADSGDASFQDTRRSSFSTPTEMLSDVQDRHYGSGANSDPHFVRTASDAEIPDGAVPTLGTAETIPKQSTTDLTVSEERQRGFDEINTGRAGGGVTGMSACGRLVCCRPGGLLYERRIRVVLFVYMLQSFISIGFQEAYPLWALSTVARGGLDWTTQDIGQILSMCGLPMMFIQFLAYPALVKRVGVNITQRLCTLVAAPVYLITPFLTRLHGHKPSLVAVSLALNIVVNGCSSALFVNLALAINNSVPPSRRGEINGVAMTIGSLAKAMGPSMSSVVFAWSISRSRPFPFGAPLIFLLLGLGMCVMAAAGWTAVGVDYQDEAFVEKDAKEDSQKVSSLRRSEGQKSPLLGGK